MSPGLPGGSASGPQFKGPGDGGGGPPRKRKFRRKIPSVILTAALSSASVALSQVGAGPPRKRKLRMKMPSVMLSVPLASASPRRKGFVLLGFSPNGVVPPASARIAARCQRLAPDRDVTHLAVEMPLTTTGIDVSAEEQGREVGDRAEEPNFLGARCEQSVDPQSSHAVFGYGHRHVVPVVISRVGVRERRDLGELVHAAVSTTS